MISAVKPIMAQGGRSKVVVGLEILLAERIDLIRDQRVGLIVNPSSVDAKLRHAIDLFRNRPEFDLVALFGPEHGARGDAQDQIEVEKHNDEATRLPVYSLYGETRIPAPEMLSQIDVLVFDMQDVGARYYTFIYTMVYAMRAAARDGKRVVVLDRPNPIGGAAVEGNVLDPEYRSFVGLYPLAVRHGMTVGELALLFNREFRIGCQLDVVEMHGWRRRMWYDQTGLPWVLPSPNMPTLDTATVYPGMCLIEGTNVSEGRGTTRPFELVGAPGVSPHLLAEELERQRLPGVRFRPAYFRPTFHKWHGELCGGVQLHVTDRRRFKPYLTGIAVIAAFRRHFKGFEWRPPPYEYEYHKLPIDILCGTDKIRKMIEAEAQLESFEASWRPELEEFKKLRAGYLLYS